MGKLKPSQIDLFDVGGAAIIRLFMKDDTPPEITYELDRLGALADQLVRSHKNGVHSSQV